MKSNALITSFLLMSLCAYSQSYPEYDIITMTVVDSAGILYDNGGKNDEYFNDSDDAFTIKPANGKRVTITFVDFQIERNEGGLDEACIYDYLEIYDGETVDPLTLVAQKCGQDKPVDFTSTGDAVTIRMFTDGAATFPGFKMFWSTDSAQVADFPKDYCDANGAPASAGDRFIINVNFNEINNNSGPSANGYSDYTDQVAVAELGQAYPITVTGDAFGLPGGAGNQAYAWIDWNNDKWLDPNTESVVLTGSGAQGGVGVDGEFAGVVTVPIDAAPGLTRLRVRFTYFSEFIGGYPQPCGADALGEVEDYSVLVTDPDNPFPACVNYISPADADANTCTELAFTWTASNGDNLRYNFRLIDSNGVVVKDTNLVDTTLSLGNLEANHSYQWLVIANGDNGSSLNCDSAGFETGNVNPTVDFNPDSLSVCSNDVLRLQPLITGGEMPYTVNWQGSLLGQLDDPNATDPQVMNMASETGGHTMYLNVEDNRNCSSNIDSLFVEIRLAPDITGFSAVQDSICFNDVVALNYTQGFNPVFEESADQTSWTVVVPDSVVSDQVYFTGTIGDKYYRVSESMNNCFDTSQTAFVNKGAIINQPLIQIEEGSTENCEGDPVVLGVTNYTTNIEWSDGATDASRAVTEPGIYVATYVDDLGCSVASNPVRIDIHPVPDAAILSFDLPDPLCDGDIVTVTSDAGDEMVWIVPAGATGGEIQVAATGSVYGFAENEFGCRTPSDTASFTFEPRPNKPVVELKNDSVLSTTTQAFIYYWLKDGELIASGSDLMEIVAVTNGAYILIIENETGCLSDASDTVFVTSVVGIAENPGVLGQVKVYPNPSRNALNISGLPGMVTEISVVDTRGRLVYQTDTRQKMLRISPGLSTGSYIMVVKTEKDIGRIPLIITE